MKILVGIPVLMNAELFKQSVESVLGREGVDLVIIDNGSDADVKAVIRLYELLPNVHVVKNEVNQFVNFAWNQLMYCFLHNEYDYLCIMNSDLVLHPQWHEVVKKRWEAAPSEILIPVISDAMLSSVETDIFPTQEVYSGTAGVFITMNKEQCKWVYPIPSFIKIWFGDLFIYSILRSKYKTVIPPNLIATHAWSSTVSRLAGAGEIIEQDKIAWENIVSKEVQKRIKQN